MYYSLFVVSIILLNFELLFFWYQDVAHGNHAFEAFG
jgi:hypothetical protein